MNGRLLVTSPSIRNYFGASALPSRTCEIPEEAHMKLLIIGAAAAATLFAALPASAEVVVRSPGGAVVVGGHRHYDHGYHHGWRRHHADCRVVKVRTHRPDGSVVVRTRRTC
jgi:hypothetical protein